ncbi:MAG: transporter permease [Clostridiales bacterium]|jgi:putative aldouronate transport system permease protein|nr:transporter permease [Clostridiales bacterium]
MNRYNSLGSRIFDSFNYSILTLYAVAAIIPLLYVIGASFASGAEIAAKGFVLIPSEPTLASYKYIFSTSSIRNSLMISLFVTVVGTLINMLLTSLTAYPLADRSLPGRNVIMALITFTMVFSAGMIPSFLLVKSLHMYNSLWALIIPGAINTWNLIVLKNFFQQIPVELLEAGKIDGCNDIGILFRIVLPLSAPALATISLFYAVANWNAFFAAIMYISDTKKWPIQVVLRQVIMMAQMIGSNETTGAVTPPSESIKMAVILVATMPILLVYPFLQKHFVKGVMLGSIKG